jgi:Domain of unknown function (DUF4169)
MGDVVNLRQARKGKARAEAEMKAEENRAKFGRSKAEKQLTSTTNAQADKALDGHKRDD